MRYLITGHTGFKGSWISLLLKSMGHNVSGISLDPDSASLFRQARLEDIFEHDLRVDIRDQEALKRAVLEISPDVIIHLAAQPLVRFSYEHPIDTFETNVLGSLNLLEATKRLVNLKATLMITTDKVYKNLGSQAGYCEEDALGGDDPYSASKAAADIAIQSWIKSFGTSPIAIARAGNVIGGGDWAADRLVPDLVKAYSAGKVPAVRYPSAIRPWQHVLDCVQGYLLLVDAMLTSNVSGEWNFGPDHNLRHDVASVIETFGNYFEAPGEKWKLDEGLHPKESSFLLLDSQKARTQLGWKDLLDFESSLEWTATWYKNYVADGSRETTQSQIDQYIALASR